MSSTEVFLAYLEIDIIKVHIRKFWSPGAFGREFVPKQRNPTEESIIKIPKMLEVLILN